MGFQLHQKQWEKIHAKNEKIHLLHAKVFYKQAQMWQEANVAQHCINDMIENGVVAIKSWIESQNDIKKSIQQISLYAGTIEQHNPGLSATLIATLEEP